MTESFRTATTICPLSVWASSTCRTRPLPLQIARATLVEMSQTSTSPLSRPTSTTDCPAFHSEIRNALIGDSLTAMIVFAGAGVQSVHNGLHRGEGSVLFQLMAF